MQRNTSSGDQSRLRINHTVLRNAEGGMKIVAIQSRQGREGQRREAIKWGIQGHSAKRMDSARRDQPACVLLEAVVINSGCSRSVALRGSWQV